MLQPQLLQRWTLLASPAMLPVMLLNSKGTFLCSINDPTTKSLRPRNCQRAVSKRLRCGARRRVRYDEEDEDEEYGHNEDIAMLELYTQSARGEALLVRAVLDGLDVEVLVFKGFSSSLSHGTTADPSKSVLPSRAVIKSVDRIKGPFDPSNIEYLEKDLQWEAFKSRLLPSN